MVGVPDRQGACPGVGRMSDAPARKPGSSGAVRWEDGPAGTDSARRTRRARGPWPVRLPWAVLPLALITSYAGQPRVIPWIGATIAGIAVLGVAALWLETRADDRRGIGGLAIGAGALALAVYVRTLSPTTDVADSLEFQVVAYRLTFAHPPGYPLYTLLGRLFTLLPLGDVAYRMNLLSAVAAGVAVAVTFVAAARLTGRPAAALAGALVFAFSPAFWSQAVITEVYTLNVLLVAVVLMGLAGWSAPPTGGRRGDGWLAVATLAAGLGASHHVTIVFTAPVIAGTILRRDAGLLRQPRRLARLAAAFALGLIPMVYFFVRWPAVYGRPATAGEVLRYVTASAYGGLFDPAWPWRDPSRLWMVASDVVGQYGPAGVVLSIVGVAWLARRSLAWTAAWLATWLAYAVFRAGYHAWDGWVVLLPAQAILGIWIAGGMVAIAGAVSAVEQRVRARWARGDVAATTRSRSGLHDGSAGAGQHRDDAAAGAGSTLAVSDPGAGRTPAVQAILWTLALAAPVAQLWTHGPRADASAGWPGAAIGRAALAQPLPAGSAIVVAPELGSSLLYPQLIEGVRPDIAVAYLDTASGRKTLEAAPTRGAPVFLLGVEPPAEPAFHLRGWGPLVELGRSAWLSPGAVPHAVGRSMAGRPGITLVGYGLDAGGDAAAPGTEVGVTLVWQREGGSGDALAEGGDRAVPDGERAWLALVADDGTLAALHAGEPVGGRFPFARWSPGEVVSDAHRLAVDAAAPPGRYNLVAAIAAPGEPDAAARSRAIRIGSVTIVPAGRDLAARANQPVAVDWGKRVRLLGYDAPSAVRPGDPVDVTLYWLNEAGAAAGPATAATGAVAAPGLAATVDAGAAGRSMVELPGPGRWPAGAATATRHRLVVPPGAAAGRLPISLTVTAGGDPLPRRGAHALVWRTAPLSIDAVKVRIGAPGLDAPRVFDDGIRLVGLKADRVLAPGRRAWIGLTWEARQPPRGRYKLSVQLLDARQDRRVNVDREILHGARPTNTWRQGDLIGDWIPLDVPADALPGGYWLQIQLYDRTTRAPLAVLGTDGRPADTRVLVGAYVADATPPTLTGTTDVSFGDEIVLHGYEATGDVSPAGGGAVRVALRWAALRPLVDDRTLFVHLVHVGADGGASLVAQWDGQPFGGAFPTRLWAPGTPVDLAVALPVPPDAPAGRYRLAVGWYDLASGARLPRADGGDTFEIDLPAGK